MGLMDKIKPNQGHAADASGTGPAAGERIITDERQAGLQGQVLHSRQAPTTTGIAVRESNNSDASSALESLLAAGDMKRLTTKQRIAYYRQVCADTGLNPLTQPFEFVTLQGKMVMYARKEAASQLSRIHGVTTEIVELTRIPELKILLCKVRASNAAGRFVDDVGAVAFGDKLTGDLAAIEYMKVVTKGKRRAILSFCGLGMLDESELDAIPGARIVAMDQPVETAHVKDTAPDAPKIESRRDTAPAVASVVPDVIDAESSSDPAVFDYRSKADRQRLIAEIKSRFPGISRDNVVKIAAAYTSAALWAPVLQNLDDVLKHEKTLGADSKVLVQS